MNSIEINIPDIEFKKDFTIIYKGKIEGEEHFEECIIEIKTSKAELLRKLRYFKNRVCEINNTEEIYIHDKYESEIFKEFILSLEKNKIEINDSNYESISELSHKYGYDELEKAIEKFKIRRPDIERIIKEENVINIDETREKILSKNLDICLQNENFNKLPIPILNRILNSPNRNIKDHHLLYEFVKKIINQYRTKHEKINEEDEANLSILVGSLDYLEMSEEDLDDFLSNESIVDIGENRHMRERMKQIHKKNKINEKRLSDIEERINNIESREEDEKKKHEKYRKDTTKIINDLRNKIEEQELTICKHRELNEQFSKTLLKQINQLEAKIENYDEIKQKVNEQESKIAKFDEKISQLELIYEERKKINQIIKAFHMTSKIEGEVESANNIKGIIKIKDKMNIFDSMRSKYVINMNNSAEIGEEEYQKGTNITKLNEEFSSKQVKVGTYYIHAIIFDKFGNSEELISNPLTIRNVALEFEYTGRVQSVTLNEGTYKLEVWGSSGGNNEDKIIGGKYSGYAGKGGYSSGILKLNSRKTLYVYVGESPTSSQGGWNGGGSCSKGGAGGGGSTDISLYGSEGSSEWNTSNHFYSRIIVAGGGGGSSHTKYPSWNGGHGGGTNGGYNGNSDAKGGTQTSGNEFGVGEASRDDHNSGGGGGWYGGGSRNNGSCSWGRGGGGGSGFVYNSSSSSNYPSGCKLDSTFYLSDCSTIGGDSELPTITGTGKEKGHEGNGYAKITPL